MGSSEVVAPDWLIPGAEVVLYSVSNFIQSPYVVRTRIKRVAAQSFTVERDQEPRFRIKTMSAECGSSWSGYTRKVLRSNSTEGQAKLREARGRRLESTADIAYAAWQKSRSADHLSVLIGTLRDVELHHAQD